MCRRHCTYAHKVSMTKVTSIKPTVAYTLCDLGCYAQIVQNECVFFRPCQHNKACHAKHVACLPVCLAVSTHTHTHVTLLGHIYMYLLQGAHEIVTKAKRWALIFLHWVRLWAFKCFKSYTFWKVLNLQGCHTLMQKLHLWRFWR